MHTSMTRRRGGALFAALSALIVLMLAGAPSAYACSCFGYTFEEAVEAADLIADVTVHHDVGTDADGRTVYVVVVDRVWKGEESRAVRLSTHAQTTACGLGTIEDGTELQIWASGSDGEYSTTWCAMPTDATGDDGPRLTERLGEPADLTDQPIPEEVDPPGPSSEQLRVALAAVALLGGGAVALRMTGLAIAMALVQRRR